MSCFIEFCFHKKIIFSRFLRLLIIFRRLFTRQVTEYFRAMIIHIIAIKTELIDTFYANYDQYHTCSIDEW